MKFIDIWITLFWISLLGIVISFLIATTFLYNNTIIRNEEKSGQYSQVTITYMYLLYVCSISIKIWVLITIPLLLKFSWEWCEEYLVINPNGTFYEN
jgi:hypothetical protein